MRLLVSIIWFAWLAFTTIVASLCALPLWLMTLPLKHRYHVLSRVGAIWSWSVLLPMRVLGLWRVSIVGADKIPRATSCVYVANHASQLDIFCGFLTFKHVRFVSKRALFFVPFLGWGMALIGSLGVQRGDFGSMKRMVQLCVERLGHGDALFLFPEGGRSKDGKIQPFKAGPFQIAATAGRPIVPIAIAGTARALPKRGFLVNFPVEITITFLEPVPAERVKATDPRELAEQTRERITEALG